MSTSEAAQRDPDAWTIGRLLNWTTEFFGERGIEPARLEAEVLLAHCRGCQRILLYTAFDEVAGEELRQRFRDLVKKRAAGTPVAYLVGKREFYSLDFEVTPDVLIPRPETEHLVMAILDHAKQQGRADAPLRVLDIGTGSGIVAICLAKHLPKSQVTAVDLSPQAIEVAKRNAAKHKVDDRVAFVKGDAYQALPADAKYDFIASNPPYVTSEEMQQLNKTVRDFEPALALDGGPEGTDVIERLIREAPERLTPTGVLAIEMSPMIATRVERLIEESPLALLPTLKDIDGHARIAQARLEG
ncbi:peptide chain release factor N(5)-glutamine methyltransferase [Aeoliella mucimassa]|uniref:Release factor glutamine methyltransferase n=1 Tax=Aeoliella mucimassa TaxID=2527972 RepID=A0A518AML2_9BACT|nr:peptide chain release factor N(5)-glutamine methyltransferase [Aeoliella mucimassa]QDU55931.1 Release factor glutamine methyltransferase [Aeoliella mucimassa]